jgi:hypothetical protein
MKKETKIAVFLFFLSPALGELLSGSAPPLEFFNLFTLSLLALLYGGGTLLIRETRTRWNLQWSVIFLAIAYGIVEEGLSVKSFFNPGWVDMGPLSGYAMYFGVQWVWTLELIIYHATVSTLIPIAISDLMWPESRDKSVIGRKGLLFAFGGVAFVTILGMLFFGTNIGGVNVPYYPNPLLLIGSFATVLLLVWLAQKYRKSRISRTGRLLRPVIFGIVGFLMQALNIWLANVLAASGVPAEVTLMVQFALIAGILLFATYQLLNKKATKHHMASFVLGSLLFYVFLSAILELNGVFGMLGVGIAALALLVIWRKRVLKN